MKKGIVLSVSIVIGMTIMFIPCLQVVRAASPSQPECPSCNSFGVQRFQEKKEALLFPSRIWVENRFLLGTSEVNCAHCFLGHLVTILQRRAVSS